eukprot:956694-Lingulodinium_polyedra.AAC.1
MCIRDRANSSLKALNTLSAARTRTSLARLRTSAAPPRRLPNRAQAAIQERALRLAADIGPRPTDITSDEALKAFLKTEDFYQ